MRTPFHIRALGLIIPFLPGLWSAWDSGEWAPDDVGADTASPAGVFNDEPEDYDAEGWEPELVDLRASAAKRTYKNGRNKKTRFKPRKPRTCKTITVHQTGVERAVDSTRYDRISAHYVIRCDGAILVLFDHTVRLYSSNALDRAPYHAVNIEVAGNFEGEDGSGRWYKPETFGRGRANGKQLRSLCWLIDKIAREEPIEMVAPHRISGRTKRRGKWVPNRQICPGSRVWRCAEEHALRIGLRTPDAGETAGGLTIPPEWRSKRWRALHEERAAA